MSNAERWALVMGVRRLVWCMMRRMRVPPDKRSDVLHGVLLKLFERSADYDPAKSKFVTFASWIARGAIGWELACDRDFGPVNREARHPERVGAFHLLDLEDPQDVHRELERGQLQGMCKAEVMRLPLKERMAIMHTCNDQTMASMGSAVGLSRERIRQLRNRAIGKVRAAMGVHE